MKRIIGFAGVFVLLCGLIPIQSKAAGFNEVPWVKYTIVDTIAYNDSVTPNYYSKYNVSVNLPDSMANYCTMHTYAFEYWEGGIKKVIPTKSDFTSIEAGIIKTNFSVSSPFIVKIFGIGESKLYHESSAQAYFNKGSATIKAYISLCISGVWDTVFQYVQNDPYNQYYPQEHTYNYGGFISPSVSGTITGIKINCISRASTVGGASSWVEAYAYNDFTIDSVYIGHIGIEEKSNIKNQKSNIEITPNLFTGKAVISYELLNEGKTQLKIYDIAGKCVKTLVDGNALPGSYKKTIESKDYDKGVYFVKISTGSYKETKKMVVLK
ncbi:MAG: T9SS type A sorting domain-containing protein [bacterium]|nr:T9SS type A sorting domain-containing protein [bacterium]